MLIISLLYNNMDFLVINISLIQYFKFIYIAIDFIDI